MKDITTMNRFIDLHYSFKILTPIEGFLSEQIVSIEEALQPIESKIDELSYYIKKAKKRCHYPSEHGLTRDESASIYIYTMEWGKQSLYRVLNKTLRNENRDLCKVWFPYLKLFITALDKLPTLKRRVWRGVAEDIRKNFTADEIITWWSVNSCSSSRDVIKRFLSKEKPSTIFSIEASNGKNVSGYTKYENENEIILRMGTKFRVKRNPVKRSDRLYVVYLIEIDEKNNDNNHTSTLTSSINQMQLTTNRNSSKPSFNKWKQNAITMAGGNGQGQQLNQLNRPFGISINKKKNIFIVDRSNHRVLKWKYNTKEGQIIIDRNNEKNQMNPLNYPTNMIIDRRNRSIIIADQGNRQVIQWLNQKQQILIDNIDCYGLAMDKYEFLYVSDYKKNEVRRWKMGKHNEGIIVAGGKGEGDQLNQLNSPGFIFVDEEQSVYVSDTYNHRVIKWTKGAKEGIIVAGGNKKGKNLNQLCYPAGVIVDHLGQIYTADCGNHRVIRWCEGREEGEIVVGGNGKGNQSDQLNRPCGLSFDDEENLYIADYYNHRIQKFEMVL
ncbi:unnamed protein product [Adineta steineri]|uniref:NAD(P)(+)--arginine ADP-ribosyltransferase n=1 Tax=Adineta steineri TaxID=433720 RepID=A0A815I322_9BILA|nr:unnamed protein product [Adineta steineri]CAF4114806.1 unnamed protein product [Adineta steineri]